MYMTWMIQAVDTWWVKNSGFLLSKLLWSLKWM